MAKTTFNKTSTIKLYDMDGNCLAALRYYEVMNVDQIKDVILTYYPETTMIKEITNRDTVRQTILSI